MPIFKTSGDHYQPEEFNSEDFKEYLAAKSDVAKLEKELVEKQTVVANLPDLPMDRSGGELLINFAAGFNKSKKISDMTTDALNGFKYQLIAIRDQLDGKQYDVTCYTAISEAIEKYEAALNEMDNIWAHLKEFKEQYISPKQYQERLNETFIQAITSIANIHKVDKTKFKRIETQILNYRKLYPQHGVELILAVLRYNDFDDNSHFHQEIKAVAIEHTKNIAMVKDEQSCENLMNIPSVADLNGTVDKAKKLHVNNSFVPKPVGKDIVSSPNYSFYIQAFGLSIAACGLTAVILGTCGLAGVPIIAMSVMWASTATGCGLGLTAGGSLLFFEQSSKQERAEKIVVMVPPLSTTA